MAGFSRRGDEQQTEAMEGSGTTQGQGWRADMMHDERERVWCRDRRDPTMCGTARRPHENRRERGRDTVFRRHVIIVRCHSDPSKED
jgi:hypothetical protein